jgi:hypothetical protein
VTELEIQTRVDAAKTWAAQQRLTYLPAFVREGGRWQPRALEVHDAIKVLFRKRLLPYDVLAHWLQGRPADELGLSLCTRCSCAPVANATGTCYRCEARTV